MLQINLETLLILTIVILAWIIIYLLKNKTSEKKDNSINLLQEELHHLTKTLDYKLSETNNQIDKKLSESNKNIFETITKNFDTSSRINKNSNKTIEEITKKLTQIEETNKQIRDLGWQLKWLENILKNPKQRWILWEYFLEELLENIFQEDQYSMQYKLGSGIVDAAIFIWDKTIAIDSKFPHENYEKIIKSDLWTLEIKKFSSDLKKDIKNRINETSKYILPEKWTTDFAFMLIPAEWIYYDIFINKVWNIKTKEIIEYAFSKKVIICSPSSFYAYLQTVLQWMKALKIEKEAHEIQKYVIKLQKDLSSYEELFNKIWNNLQTTVNSYNQANKRLNIIDKDIYKISEWKAWWDWKYLEIDWPKNY